MASLKEVRNRINSVKSTQQITKAMKMVAASKLRKAQENIINMRPYSQMLNDILDNLSANIDSQEFSSEYMEAREPNKVLIVVVTSDRGLCGAFNNNIIKATTRIIQEKYAQQAAEDNVSLLCIGRKGHDFFKKRYKNVMVATKRIEGEDGTITREPIDVYQNLNFGNLKDTIELILEDFREGNIDKVELVFNEFKNVITQILHTDQYLPIVQKEEEDGKSSNTDYIFEPSANEIIENLIPNILKVQLYRAILESNAAEQGARMSAMDQATENAGELLKELKLTYNRSRQAAITKEILEIVGGAEALNAE